MQETPTPPAVPARTVVMKIPVEFGDCDPARIVWFPNFFRWVDAASRNFFVECGVPSWDEAERIWGVNGTPLVDTQARFFNTATYGETLEIHTTVTEWRNKSFVHEHRVQRGETPIMTCIEIRVFSAPKADGSRGIRAVPIPADIQRLCSQQ